MINYLNSTPKDIITLKQIKYCNIYIYIYIYIYIERERERERERDLVQYWISLHWDT
jgi:hypothetical protein